MIKPEYLKKGDKIGIVSPGKNISEKKVIPAINKLKQWGLEVVLGAYMYQSFNQFAGTDEQRAEDLQKMLDDDSIKAILCARGGYGTIRIIERLNFDRFINAPKWLIGYSDITVLHSFVNYKLNIETLHATMPLNFPANEKDNETTISLKNALFGNKIEYNISPHKLNRQGTARGILTGGNLSVLYSLQGTDIALAPKDKILFIEDIDEYLYHIDRMMFNFKLSGKLAGLNGLIVGGMSKMKDDKPAFGKTAYEIISEAVSGYNYPVCYDFPAGHIEDNFALIFGREISLKVDEFRTKVSFKDK